PFTSDKPHYENNLPSGWCLTNIEELLINRDGERKPVSSAIRSKQKNKVYDYYGAAGIIDKVDGFIFDERLLLIGEDGANLLSRSKDNAFFAEGKYWVNNHAHVLDATDKNLLDFVAIVINAMKLDDYITGSAQPKLSQDNLNKIPIALPPLQEQKRLVKELNHWFSLVDCIGYQKDNLQNTINQTKSKILDLAIHGKLVPQDPTDEPATELLKRINPNAGITSDNGHYQKLPEGWCECTLGSLFLFIRNGINIHQDKSKIGYPITRIETISSEFIDRSRMGYAAITEDNYSDYYLQKDDILMSHINSPIHVGKCALCDIKAGEKIIHGMNLLCLRPYPDIEAKFILMVFRSPYFKDEIRPFIKNAVNQASINIRNLSSVHLHLPPVSEQHRIVAKIEEIFAQFDAIEASL
ncbi:restriction endonuclease subunit S, partial [Leyella stercorea]|uniref:restriction endonuclease subunit S n=1 Tax=Leyella stercorea TaxID=363265 RepID=UPI00242F759C